MQADQAHTVYLTFLAVIFWQALRVYFHWVLQ